MVPAAPDPDDPLDALPLLPSDTDRLPDLREWATRTEKLRERGILTVGVAQALGDFGIALAAWASRAELHALEAEDARQAAQERGPRKRRAA